MPALSSLFGVSPDLTSFTGLLQSLGNDNLFALLVVAVVMGTALTAFSIVTLTIAYCNLRQLRMRTGLLTELTQQGRSQAEIVEIMQLASRGYPSKRQIKEARRARAAMPSKPVASKPSQPKQRGCGLKLFTRRRTAGGSFSSQDTWTDSALPGKPPATRPLG